MASEGTESETASASGGAAAVDHQGGQGGLESDWKVPPAPAAAGVSQSEVESSLDKKRSRVEETQRRLAAEMAAVQAEEARIEQEERMKKERIEAEAARIEAEAARIEQEEKMEKERIEQEKKMAKEKIEEAEEKKRPPPRMVVRDVIDYITVEGPLEANLHDFREAVYIQEEYIRANPLPLTIHRVPNPQLVVWAQRRKEVAEFLEDNRSLSDSVGFLTQQGYQPLGSAFQTGRALPLLLPNLCAPPNFQYNRRILPVYNFPCEFNMGLFAQVMVKYGPPRYDTPYLWNKTEESIAIAGKERIAQAEAQRRMEEETQLAAEMAAVQAAKAAAAAAAASGGRSSADP